MNLHFDPFFALQDSAAVQILLEVCLPTSQEEQQLSRKGNYRQM